MAFIKFAASQLQQIGEKKKAQEAASAKPAIEEAPAAPAPAADTAADPDTAAPAAASASATDTATDAGATDPNKILADEAKRIVEDITDSITGEKKESKSNRGGCTAE